MRLILSSILFTALVGCTDSTGPDEDQGADINNGSQDDAKADGVTTGIEVMQRLRPGTVDVKLSAAFARQGYIFFAAEGTKVSLETTQAGSQQGADTQIKIYGPRLSDGSYPKTLATDEDSGYGKLARVRDLTISIPGFYLVEVANGAHVTTPGDLKTRLKLSCTGVCDTDLPVSPLGNDIKWFQRSAERKALALQAYGLAGAKVEAKAPTLTGPWGVVLDIDETSLDNSTIQHERADLGLGFSQAAWTGWVNRKAATALPGALAFTQKVHALGGKVVFVSNRLLATECAQTEENLHAQGFVYEGILCKTMTSDKNPRFASLTAGTSGIANLPALTIAAYVGDNIQDFPALTQDVRKQADTAFASFGDSFFIMPNPMYGSWEKNLD